MAKATTPAVSPHAIAEVLMHIGHIADSMGYTQGLKPSQWTALRYFVMANPSQRTVSAFADFHATTRGAASQMVDVLVGKGLLTRQPQERDRRVTLLVPTDRATELLADDPLHELSSVVEGLEGEEQYALADLLSRVLRGVLQKRRIA
jgi:DNA-binding MarR family transcriptional regulator